MTRIAGFPALMVWLSSQAATADLSSYVNNMLPQLLTTYRELHREPELSYREKKTSTFLSQRLRTYCYEIHTQIGRYPQHTLTSYGVVAVLHNGAGPRVLVRTEMDALPVIEQTGLPYASTVRDMDVTGAPVGVAHACGHDLHMTVFLGTARLLAELRDRWHGTVLLVAQPAEEMGAGAKAMLADRMYEKFGRPDFTLTLHDDPEVPVGEVGYVSGFAMAALDSVDIVVRGWASVP